MVDPNSTKFIASLVKSLQMLCHGYMEFNNNIEIIGHINVRIDNSQKFDYIVNEQVSKQGGESTFFQSNSYHSLPPSKCGRGERDHSGRYDDDGTVNNHHRLVDDSVARVQVDLSGPVPVTRSTSAPSPDGFFSTSGNSRRRSHSRDSRLHSVEEEQVQGSLPQDHSFNHSSISSKELELAANGTEDRTELLAMYKDSDRSRLHNAAQIMVKNEPNDRMESMDESGAEAEALDASSTSSMLPAAHQSALAAHAGHAMLATTTLGHPSFFDTASLSQQDVAEVHPGESSYRSVAMGDERGSGQDLSKQCPQNGEAMSLVTRNRTPPDLSYPTGPTQLPQTADVGGKEMHQASEKNRCDHCSKNFRNAQLLEMHIALIHTHRNYMSPKSMRNNSYLPSLSMSPSSQGAGRRTSQSPGHQSTSSSSSRSKSQSPISLMSHSQAQPLALTHSMPPHGGESAASLGMSLPNMPNTMTTCHSSTAAAAAMAAVALAQSYSMEQSQVGPMMGNQGAPSMQGSAFQCHLCHMPFVSWGLLAAHQNHCPRRGPHRCEQCGKAFRSKTSLTDHINTIHRGMLFICKGCRETFKWRTHIYQHKRKCPALQNATFESGSFFIEEMSQPPLPPEPQLPPPSMEPVAAGEGMDDSARVN
ncbi:uncharacterized protein [Littorina saxatilis]|uniref:C2H2-type domain-containing protein n=1 Tax=Littorina saxatilis TaxID=31220 RepID=A0AAN9GJ59_9CAEN